MGGPNVKHWFLHGRLAHFLGLGFGIGDWFGPLSGEYNSVFYRLWENVSIFFMASAAGEDVRTTSTQALKLNVPSSLTLYANVPLFCGCISLFMTVCIVAPNYIRPRRVSGLC